MSDQTTIKCPNCGESIDVNDILKHQIEDALRKDFQEEKARLINEQKKREQQFELEKAEFEKNRTEQEELFEEKLAKERKRAAQEIERKLKAKLQEENEDRIAEMRKELDEKSDKLKELNKKEAEIERLKREKDEAMDQAKLEAERELTKRLEAAKETIRKNAESANELKLKELEKQLADQKKLTEEMKRKQEQGSMQLQGEVQELAIEEFLASNFPLDTIEEIKKGALGGDCIQTVNTRELRNCGKIYYESKRTKNFQPSWIEKFKNDIRERNADVGILVTEVLPSDMDRMGMKEGIWICTFDEFKGLSAVIRQSVIQISFAMKSQENKGDKMVMLYDFLTSNEFRLQIEGIVEGFTQMQVDLNSEKNAMQRIWKKREKQIEKVISNTINMHGSIKGIAGAAIKEIKLLELDE